MVVVSYSGKEINAKLVYYGAGLSGKTTNLESIYEAVPDTSRGKMVSMKTQSDRTLFFDLLPLDLGEIMGFKTRFLLYTVPGQVFYNATRKLVLKGADAIVFVADSEVGKMEENRESIGNLRANLAEYGLNLDQLPWVIQYNKRDLPNVYTLEELNAELNPGGKVPFFEAVATQGKGVFETFRGISHLLMEKVTRDLRRAPMAGGAVRPAAEEHVAAPARPEAQRLSPATLPTAPGRAIAHEAHAMASEPQVANLDYGREIALPASALAAAAAPPAPASPSVVMPRPEPIAAASPVHRAAPAPVQHAAPAPVQHAAPAPVRHAAPAPVHHAAPAPAAPVHREAPPMPAPMAMPQAAPAVDPNGHPTAAASEGAMVVPVRIPRNGSREIVLRIVLSVDE